MTFMKLKAYFIRIDARTNAALHNAVAEIVDLFSRQDCSSYFSAACDGIN